MQVKEAMLDSANESLATLRAAAAAHRQEQADVAKRLAGAEEACQQRAAAASRTHELQCASASFLQLLPYLLLGLWQAAVSPAQMMPLQPAAASTGQRCWTVFWLRDELSVFESPSYLLAGHDLQHVHSII